MAAFSVPYPFNSKYNIFTSSAPQGAKYDSMCLWQVYAFLNQVLLQKFEFFFLIANYSYLYELLFIGLEPRMLPWQQNFSYYFVCLGSLHLYANFHFFCFPASHQIMLRSKGNSLQRKHYFSLTFGLAWLALLFVWLH